LSKVQSKQVARFAVPHGLFACKRKPKAFACHALWPVPPLSGTKRSSGQALWACPRGANFKAVFFRKNTHPFFAAEPIFISSRVSRTLQLNYAIKDFLNI